MLNRFKLRFKHQALFLICSSVIAYGLCLLLNIRPRLHATPVNFLTGAAAGIGLGLLIAGIHSLAALRRKQHASRLEAQHRELRKISTPATIGAAVVSAAGEEVLLRGVIFAALAVNSTLLAFAVNFFISGLSYFDRANPRTALIKAVEGTAYAALYQATYALTVLVCARFFAELIWPLLLRSKRAIKILCRPKMLFGF